MQTAYDLEGQWYNQQVEYISDALSELLTSDDPQKARKAILEAIDGWVIYHKKEADKWNALRNLLNL